jgi:hypothetical protein
MGNITLTHADRVRLAEIRNDIELASRWMRARVDDLLLEYRGFIGPVAVDSPLRDLASMRGPKALQMQHLDRQIESLDKYAVWIDGLINREESNG